MRVKDIRDVRDLSASDVIDLLGEARAIARKRGASPS